MASSIPSQTRAVDPFASYNSNSVNMLSRMFTYGQDGLSTSLSCDVIADATSNTEAVVQPGFVFKDDVWIHISAQHTVDFTDSDHYYNFDSGFDESGYYYIVLEYIYVKSRPAPQAQVLIVKPSQRASYTEGGQWLFLKAVKVEGSGPFYAVSFHDSDPEDTDNKRVYTSTYMGSEVSLPTHVQQTDESRVIYSKAEDDFYFGFSDKWLSLITACGASYSVDTNGFVKGELVYTRVDGNLSLALATLKPSTADGVVTKQGVYGIVQTVGKVEDVPVETGVTVTDGDLLYLSKSETGKVTNQITGPLSQFVGRCIDDTDSTSITMLFHRGEPSGSLTDELAIALSEVTLLSGNWNLSGSDYYQDVDITDIQEKNCAVTVWDSTSEYKIEPLDLEFINDNTLRVWMSSGATELVVFVVGLAVADLATSSVDVVTETLAAGGSWISDSGLYYQDIDVSSLIGQSSVVLVKNTATSEQIYPTQIQFDSTSNLRIWMSVNTEELEVVAIGESGPGKATVVLTTILASGASWTPSAGDYFQNINISDFGVSDDLVVQFYDIATDKTVIPATVDFSTPGNIKVWMTTNTSQLNVTIIG